MQARPATLWADPLDPGDHALLDPGVPARLDRRPDVLVVGGGVIGLATAVFCRRAGLGRILVIEAARLAAGASGGAGGALVPELHRLSDPPAFVALARASLGRYRQLDQEWDRALGWQDLRAGGGGGTLAGLGVSVRVVRSRAVVALDLKQVSVDLVDREFAGEARRRATIGPLEPIGHPRQTRPSLALPWWSGAPGRQWSRQFWRPAPPCRATVVGSLLPARARLGAVPWWG